MTVPGGQDVVITYFAWNARTQLGATGDAANHTLRLIRDGNELTLANSPIEVDGTLMKGIYKILVTAAELAGLNFCLGGNSSAIGVRILPTNFTVD